MVVKALEMGKHRLMAGNAVKKLREEPYGFSCGSMSIYAIGKNEELGRKIERAGVYIKNKGIFETGCCLINCPQ